MFALILFFKILLTILMIIIAILIIMLAIPYTYIIDYKVSKHISGTASVKMLGRLLKFQHEKHGDKYVFKVYLFNLVVFSKDYYEEESIEEKVNLKIKKSVNLKAIGFKFMQKTVKYLYEIGNLVKPKVFVICGTYGFDDPLVTGTIAAVVPIIKTMVSSVDINVTPVFLDENLNIDIKCKGKLNLLVIGFKTLRFMLNKNIRKFLKHN